MNIKVDTPQEVEVWYLLPAIRKQLMVSMINQGLKQNEVAKHLNLTDAAVSQYIHNKRAAGITLPEKITGQIDESAMKIIKKESSMQQEVQHIMQSLWGTRFICQVCKGRTGQSDDCEVCYT
ncbi:MAG: hypothetical protein EPN86_05565 [Nanoarchaeota archaeon]|nr:MAG: hypothetical protein EPN86_05565 [Nanoarchaeota archaeon]